MADLEIEDGHLVVAMSGLEKVEAFHPTVRVPLSAVTELRVAEDPWPELRGWRAPGTGVPGVIAVGTRRGPFGRDFAVVHGSGPAVVVELSGADYSRLVVTVDDPAASIERIRSAQAVP